MSFITVFVAAVPTANKDLYIAHATEAAAVFKKYGASRIVECWGSDVPPGKLTSFPMAVQCEADETVVTGFVEWPSKATHDEGMPRFMAEMDELAKSGAVSAPPFDGKRMIFGDFDVVLDL